MSRSARPLLRLLALLLLLQWGAGLWPHLGGMAGTAQAGEMVIICTPDGFHSLRIGPDGQPLEEDGPSLPKAAGCCQLCQAPLTGADLVPGPVLPAPRLVAGPAIAMVAQVQALSFRPPPAIRHSRAPPQA
ncbi:DUF2946 family protein [Roseomonas sp. 18066]|uniref:DUF2946 family protein n=1 Tax=Roseomonas sp. 18066 TaxID=2681412 RepID=UPI00135BF266|nr:DUF2946 family protein [Roseomonas sp. 18066]